MHLPTALLPVIALAVSCACAGRLPFDAPGSPRSSVQGAIELKDVLRQRQAQSADIVRRLKDGPKRKRQDPSAVAMCSIPSGTNVVQNPGFETGGVSPWSTVISGGHAIVSVLAGYGYAMSYGFGIQGDPDLPSTVSLEQSVTVCAGVAFDVAFDLGRVDYGDPACSLDITLSGDGFTTLFYSGSPCASGECTIKQDHGVTYTRVNLPNAITFTARQAASPVIVKALFVCAADGTVITDVYNLDNVVLARA